MWHEQRRLSHVGTASARRRCDRRDALSESLGALQITLSPADIDYVNLHGTGTKANDSMEDIAIVEVFGTTAPCSSTKGWTGHTLGASGILEAVIAGLCIGHDIMPGCLNVAAVDPTFRARVLVTNKQN